MRPPRGVLACLISASLLIHSHAPVQARRSPVTVVGEADRAPRGVAQHRSGRPSLVAPLRRFTGALFRRTKRVYQPVQVIRRLLTRKRKQSILTCTLDFSLID